MAKGCVIQPRAALSHVDTFAAYLKERLPHHRLDTLRRLTEVLFGILQAESTLHRKIAAHINRTASPASITRMVARTFHETNLTPQDVQDLSRGQNSDGDLRSRLLYGVFCDERHPEPTRSV